MRRVVFEKIPEDLSLNPLKALYQEMKRDLSLKRLFGKRCGVSKVMLWFFKKNSRKSQYQTVKVYSGSLCVRTVGLSLV